MERSHQLFQPHLPLRDLAQFEISWWAFERPNNYFLEEQFHVLLTWTPLAPHILFEPLCYLRNVDICKNECLKAVQSAGRAMQPFSLLLHHSASSWKLHNPKSSKSQKPKLFLVNSASMRRKQDYSWKVFMTQSLTIMLKIGWMLWPCEAVPNQGPLSCSRFRL